MNKVSMFCFYLFMYNMKKSVGVVVLIAIIVVVALFVTDKEDVKTGWEVENNNVAVNDVNENDGEDVVADEEVENEVENEAEEEDTTMFNEYQLDVEIISTDGEGNEYAVKTNMYKKWDNLLYVIEEMTGPDELPFVPTQNLIAGSDLYTQIEIDGELMWFKASGVEEQQNVMFDLADMQSILEESQDISEVKEEEVEGEMMTCYYLEGSNGRACMVDGIFAYGEDTDPISGMSSVIRVTNYQDSVDDSVFEIPSDDEVKTMEEFMSLMMAELSEEALLPPVEEEIDPDAVGEAEAAAAE